MKQKFLPKVILVTGASSGLGKACAELLLQSGHVVYGTSRKVKFINNSAEGALKLIPMDVDDDMSVARAIGHIIDENGVIDVVVNNAGYGLAGAIEDTRVDEAKALFETNFFGVHRVCREVLPYLREQQSGHIINVGSLGGVVTIPFQTFYSASKAALASLSDGLRMEVKPFGIKVSRIEPGDYCTGFTGKRVYAEAALLKGVYSDRCYRAVGIMEADELNGARPEQFARLLLHIIETADPGQNYRSGLLVQKLLVALSSYMPRSWVEKLLMKTYNV